MSYKKPSIVTWNPVTGQVSQVFSLPLEEIQYEQDVLIRCTENEFRIFPGLDLTGGNSRCLSIDRKSGVISDLILFKPYETFVKWTIQYQENACIYFMADHTENLFLARSGKMIQYDWEYNTLTEMILGIPLGETPETMSKKIERYELNVRYHSCFENQEIYLEDGYLGLKGMITGIVV